VLCVYVCLCVCAICQHTCTKKTHLHLEVLAQQERLEHWASSRACHANLSPPRQSPVISPPLWLAKQNLMHHSSGCCTWICDPLVILDGALYGAHGVRDIERRVLSVHSGMRGCAVLALHHLCTILHNLLRQPGYPPPVHSGLCGCANLEDCHPVFAAQRPARNPLQGCNDLAVRHYSLQRPVCARMRVLFLGRRWILRASTSWRTRSCEMVSRSSAAGPPTHSSMSRASSWAAVTLCWRCRWMPPSIPLFPPSLSQPILWLCMQLYAPVMLLCIPWRA